MKKPSSNWNLAQWLHHLENRTTQEIQLGLERISEVARVLNVLTPQCKVISVAGTNGKGSTVAALETLYHNAGFRVGSYTSPHLIHFNERIRVHLNPVTDEVLCRLFDSIDDARGEVILTYFEMITLAALVYFQENKLDVIILEVGLGGRLDATNIINSDLAIITTVDYDHQDLLGSTLNAIGYEKAGILRSNKPFIYADDNPPQSIINVANECSAPGYFYGKEFSFDEEEHHWSVYCSDASLKNIPKPNIQLKSAAAAITAVLILNRYLPVSSAQIANAMRAISLHGRLQFSQGTVSTLFDVSHNPQSARLLAKTINKIADKKKVRAVFSALKDKDISGLIFPLKDCVDHWYPAQLESKRALTADMLLSEFKNAEIVVNICYNSPFAAFQEASNQAEPGDLIVVFGSFLTVSQVMIAQKNS